MIKLLKSGVYKIVETKNGTILLLLDDRACFAWIQVKEIGDILVHSKAVHRSTNDLSGGKYRLYDVKNETKLTDERHLELLVSKGKWQGYLLPTGLPTSKEKRKRVIATKEQITNASRIHNSSSYVSNSFSSASIL